MGLVISNLSMSLDGFIEDAQHRVDNLFEWYTTGPVETESANPDIPGDKDVSIASPSIAQQALEAGLLDVITVDLVPYLLGSGTPYFANLASTPVRLDNPTIRRGNRVTHLRYPVMR
jgi:dihydrofolate reductase